MTGHHSDGAVDRDVLLAANEDAAHFYRRQLLARPNTGPRDYLLARGQACLLDETPWTIGYAPAGWTSLVDHLAAQGYSDATLLDAGLACRTRHGTLIDRFRDRLTFGIRNLETQLVAFTARCSPSASPTVPKYLNTATTVLYNKGESPFGLGEQRDSIRDGATPVLVEGPFDALAVDLIQQRGKTGFAGLALCGTAISGSFVELLAQLNSHGVLLAFDSDDAGNLATERAALALAAKFKAARAIKGQDAGDPAETLTRSGALALRNQLLTADSASVRVVDARIDRWADRLDNAEAKVACLHEAAALLAHLRPTNAAVHARHISERLGLGTEIVTRELAEATSSPQPGLNASTTQLRVRPIYTVPEPRATTRDCWSRR